jgi:dolichol kinase
MSIRLCLFSTQCVRFVQPQWALTLTGNLRKLIHLAALAVPLMVELTSKTLILAALSLVTIIFALEEVLRLRGRRLPIITRFTLAMSSSEEAAGFIVRPIYLAAGIILALVLYPRLISYAAIGICAVGDPVAAYVGGHYGRTHVTGKKTLEGSAAGFLASILLASVIVSPLVALVGSAGGMLVELIDIPDDNLTIPIAAGALMTLTTLTIH